jgi:flagellar biosynthesis GTPase FlhF
MSMSNSPCQSRVLNDKKILSTREGSVEYYTTKECGGESLRKIPVDEGDAYMSACLSCFKRYIRRVKEKGFWYGWFDCDYPPEAPVVGSKWYYLTLAKKALEKHADVEEEEAPQPTEVQEEEAPETPESPEAQEAQEEEAQEEEAQEEEAQEEEAQEEEAQESQADPEIDSLTQGIAQMTINDTRESLRKRIKELRSLAKPGKMTCKEMTAAFKEIDDLRLKIRML